MLKTLPDNSRVYTFSNREILSLRPNILWLLKRGAVKTYTWNETGTVVTLGYWGPEDIIGQPLSMIQPYEIQCLTAVEAICLPQSAECFEPTSYQWKQLSEAICRSLQQMERLLCIVRGDRAYGRLLGILGWLAQKFGRPVKQGQLIDLRLTHQELAEIAGVTRVTVTRLLYQFEKENKISRPCRHTILLRHQATS